MKKNIEVLQTNHIENRLLVQLLEVGLPVNHATEIAKKVLYYLTTLSQPEAWQKITEEILIHQTCFAVHKLLYRVVYPDYDKIPRPVWFPKKDFIEKTHISKLMHQLAFDQYAEFQQWSRTHYADFWDLIVKKLHIVFDKPYKKIVDITAGIESPQWFKGGMLNIANSCFNAQKNTIAILYQNEKGDIKPATYEELDILSNCVANSLRRYLKINERAAIIMPMTPEAIAIYLGMIKAGICVVCIAEIFSAEEIAERLKIANVKVVFTQDRMLRGEKSLPLYEKIILADAPLTIVIPSEQQLSEKLRLNDISWKDFLIYNHEFSPVSCSPDQYANILFSSGTTGEPKAIPWTHITPIKCASDAYLYHNIQPNDVVCWPTSLGWMMGSWLIYASLINRATLAIYSGTPLGKDFGKFVQNAKVNILGLVPTIVKAWRASGCMEKLDWSAIKLFSSTGECSNADDMLYLMSLVNYRPIIEYCGGTEIGGAYITSTLLQPSAPAAFTTKALGLDFEILDEKGDPAHRGEAALIPPSIGLSTHLLNKDHYEIYYANMPKSSSSQILRRHGDEIEQFKNGYYKLQGRVDDTMNLDGIKISAVEIEHTLLNVPCIKETAAIAVNPSGGGPSRLIVYAVLKPKENVTKIQLKTQLQIAIKKLLNPLFKIHEVILIDALPQTISNKTMRRILKNDYEKTHG